jgi:HPt (histidine-containing phosphotransfer) domain-containing protein
MTPHIDAEQLAELKEVLEDEFGVLISTYLTDAQFRLQLIQNGINSQDFEAVRLAAHSLKGASANLGALILAQLCEQLEHDCKVGIYVNCNDILEKIYNENLYISEFLSKL